MFKQIGGVAFGFMLPVLAGYIAMAIGDRPALALGFVGGMMASSGTSGFLGALVAGFAAGYIILGLRKACEKLPEALEKIAPVLIYPVVGILAMGLLMLFIVEPIMGTVNTVLNNGLASMGGSSKLILGMILGGMMAIDMGAPVQQSSLRIRNSSHRSRKLRHYGIRYDRRYGSLRVRLHLQPCCSKINLQKEERESGPDQLHHGTRLHHRGCDSIRTAEPDPRSSGLHHRLWPRRCALHGICCTIIMAPHGGIFVVPVMGNALLYLVACCHRNSGIRSSAWSFKEKSCIKR